MNHVVKIGDHNVRVPLAGWSEIVFDPEVQFDVACSDRPVVPDVRAQGQERDGDGWVAGQQGDHVSAAARSRPSRIARTAVPGVGVS